MGNNSKSPSPEVLNKHIGTILYLLNDMVEYIHELEIKVDKLEKIVGQTSRK